MKKQGILNSEIASVLAKLGHTDKICIGDCGLPIPEGVKRIDLAVKLGTPTFYEVLEEVLKDMEVEQVVMAKEMETHNFSLAKKLEEVFARNETGFKILEVSHEELKELTRECKAVIRTGENTPYANVILQSGCIFS